MYPYKSAESRTTLSHSRSFSRSIAAAFADLAQAAANKLFDMIEVSRQRRALARLDDRLLKDIGITRCDVEQEISRPFWR